MSADPVQTCFTSILILKIFIHLYKMQNCRERGADRERKHFFCLLVHSEVATRKSRVWNSIHVLVRVQVHRFIMCTNWDLVQKWNSWSVNLCSDGMQTIQAGLTYCSTKRLSLHPCLNVLFEFFLLLFLLLTLFLLFLVW